MCDYAVAGVGLMKEVERGREVLSISASGGKKCGVDLWPNWSSLRQLLQQVFATGPCLNDICLI